MLNIVQGSINGKPIDKTCIATGEHGDTTILAPGTEVQNLRYRRIGVEIIAELSIRTTGPVEAYILLTMILRSLEDQILKMSKDAATEQGWPTKN